MKPVGALRLLDAYRTPAGVFTFEPARPTIVLVHGAFLNPSAWDEVGSQLRAGGYRALAPANPLRGLPADAAAIAALVRSIPGDVVLVGHGYGGFVVTEAAIGVENVRALVYVAGFIPEVGESLLALSLRFRGCTLGDALEPATRRGPGAELYVQPPKFRAQCAADVPAGVAALMAATQRPVTRAALCSQATVATWRGLPAVSIYGSADRNIPAELQRYMAGRATLVRAVEIAGGSHALLVSQAEEVAALVKYAAAWASQSRTAVR